MNFIKNLLNFDEAEISSVLSIENRNISFSSIDFENITTPPPECLYSIEDPDITLNHMLESISEINSYNIPMNDKCFITKDKPSSTRELPCNHEHFDFCIHDHIIREKNHIFIGFIALEDIVFTFTLGDYSYTKALSKGEFAFALDDEGVIPMVHIKDQFICISYSVENGLKYLYVNICGNIYLNRKLASSYFVFGKHLFHEKHSLVTDAKQLQEIINIKILPSIHEMWLLKKNKIEERMNVIKKELIHKCVKRCVCKNEKLMRVVTSIIYKNILI